MQIFIKRMTGKVVTIDASDSDTILVIKEKFEDKEGLSPEQVCLIFGGWQDAGGLQDLQGVHAHYDRAGARLGGLASADHHRSRVRDRVFTPPSKTSLPPWRPRRPRSPSSRWN